MTLTHQLYHNKKCTSPSGSSPSGFVGIKKSVKQLASTWDKPKSAIVSQHSFENSVPQDNTDVNRYNMQNSDNYSGNSYNSSDFKASVRTNQDNPIFKAESNVKEQFKAGNVKYLDNIKSQEWSTSRGLQLPKLVQSNPDNNIILYKDDIVKRYNMKILNSCQK